MQNYRKYIFVTGATGFIGKNFVRHLRSTPKHNIIEFSREDHIEDLERIIHKIDIVFHLAGLNKKTINEDFKEVNIKLTKKLCKILEKNLNTKIYLLLLYKLKRIMNMEGVRENVKKL